MSGRSKAPMLAVIIVSLVMALVAVGLGIFFTVDAHAATPCVNSVYNQSPQSTCDFPSYGPSIIGAQQGSSPWVSQNVWNPQPGGSQTLTAYSPRLWHVDANVNTHFGGVTSFPDTGFWMGNTSGTSKVDSYLGGITSTYSVTLPTDTTKTAAWAAYDLWFNNWADEVMIQPAATASSAYDCTAQRTDIDFHGVPWHLCVFGSERVWKPGVDDSHRLIIPKGSVDVGLMLRWMEASGYLPLGSVWTAASFGFEIADTEGQSQQFSVNDFTWNASTTSITHPPNYSHDFRSQGVGDWALQGGHNAPVVLSKQFGLGINVAAKGEWSEYISSLAKVGPNSTVNALIYVPPVPSTGQVANWPALWSSGSIWPADGEIDGLEGQHGRASFQTHWGPNTPGELSSPGSLAPLGFTGWLNVTIVRHNGSVTATYVNTANGKIWHQAAAQLPTNAVEYMKWQDQYSLVPNLFGNNGPFRAGIAWLAKISVVNS